MSTTTAHDSAPVDLPRTRTHLFDPPPELASLRAQRPVCPLRYPDGEVGWLVTSHELARAVLNDARFSPRGAVRRLPVGDPAKLAEFCDGLEAAGVQVANLLDLDPPEHTRIRRLLAPEFTVRRVQDHRPTIERIVGERLAAMEQAGPPVDLKETFASPVALRTQCALIGIPGDEGGRFLHLHERVLDPSATAEAPLAAVRDLREYLRGVIEEKRREPGDDLLSYVVRRHDLTEAELLSVIQMFFDAGVDTVATMLTLGTFALLCHPDELAALRVEPSRIDGAVEELLRYLTIFQVGALTRTAREDVDVGGTAIGAGERATVSLAAANRDPDKFDHPDRLDIGRPERGHLAFGGGAHICLGAHLGRLQLRVGLTELLRRFPTLSLAGPTGSVRVYGGDRFAYGVHELPVTW